MEIAGTFPAVAVEMSTEDGPSYAQLGRASTGTMQVLMSFKILSGEHVGRQVPWIGYCTKDTVDGTLKALRTAGMKGEDLNALYGDDRQALNQQVEIVVEMKPTQDGSKSYPQVRWVNAPGGGGLKLREQLNKTDRLKFAAQLKAKLKAIPEVAGSAPSDEPPAEDRGDDPMTDARVNGGSLASNDLPF